MGARAVFTMAARVGGGTRNRSRSRGAQVEMMYSPVVEHKIPGVGMLNVVAEVGSKVFSRFGILDELPQTLIFSSLKKLFGKL